MILSESNNVTPPIHDSITNNFKIMPIDSVQETVLKVSIEQIPKELMANESWWDINGWATIFAGISLILSLCALFVDKNRYNKERKLELIKTLILDHHIPNFHKNLGNLESVLYQLKNNARDLAEIDSKIQNIIAEINGFFQSFAEIDIKFYLNLNKYLSDMHEKIVDNMENIGNIDLDREFTIRFINPVQDFKKKIINKIYKYKVK